MRKLVIVISLMIISFQTYAQIQPAQPRNPNYYYDWWYEDWWNTGKPFFVCSAIKGPWDFNLCLADIDEAARVIYLDTPVTAIGIAFISNEMFVDTLGFCGVNYARMYEVNDREITCVGENPWIHQGCNYAGDIPEDSIHFGFHKIFLDCRQEHLSPNDTMLEYQLYETYFPAPVVMHDTMALALNLVQDVTIESYNKQAKRVAFALSASLTTTRLIPVGVSYDPDFPWFHYKFRRRTPGTQEPVPGAQVSELLPWQDTIDQVFMCIFPILDTVPFFKEDICEDIKAMQLVTQQDSVFVFYWDNYLYHSRYEFSYAPEGVAPEEGNVSICYNSVKTVMEADSGVIYKSYVRAYCDTSDLWTEWTEGPTFCYDCKDTLPSQEGIQGMIGKYMNIMPNPASGEVTVCSSYFIRHLEIYNVMGQMIRREKVGGLGKDLDISDLESGIYLVKIVTPVGTATKKLVVK